MGNLYEHLFATESTLKEGFFSDTSLIIIKMSQNKILASVLSLQQLDILDV